MDFLYRASIRTQLLEHGIRPQRSTPPGLIRQLLNSLYVFEIRELRRRRREVEDVFGPQPLDAYSKQVLDLKERYPALAVPLDKWLEVESSRH